MNTVIKTNKLIFDFDFNQLALKYDVFEISTSDNYFDCGAYLLDAPSLCNNVCSVYFQTGRRFYVLMKKENANKNKLSQVLRESENGDKITISTVSLSCLSKRVLLSLLLNALGSYELEFLRFNNLTGHLYCFHPKWMKKSVKNNITTVIKIPCLEVAVTEELYLKFEVKTFTSESLKNKISFKKRKFEQYPKYILGAENTLRRKLRQDTQQGYLLRQTDNDRTEIPFLDIQSLERFEMSKLGVVERILRCFNNKYKGMCSLDFDSVNDYVTLDTSKKVVKENFLRVYELLRDKNIRIVDYIDDEYSKRFCEEIQMILKNQYHIQTKICKRTNKEALNICVVHNKSYYEGANDPYLKKKDGSIQHITLEDFLGNSKAAITTIVHELLIKHDIETGRLSLFDWEKTGINEEISFGARFIQEEQEKYIFMHIRPDGSFTFDEQTLDLFSLNQYTECIQIFADHKDVEGVIRFANGDINIIKKTSWITIPETNKIYTELSLGNTYLRGKEKRNELFESITDIKMFQKDNCKYYFTGIIGEGMRTNVTSAANIRKLESYKNASVNFESLLSLMNVMFVRNGQLTVLPFPFKYLREYYKKTYEKSCGENK